MFGRKARKIKELKLRLKAYEEELSHINEFYCQERDKNNALQNTYNNLLNAVSGKCLVPARNRERKVYHKIQMCARDAGCRA